MTGDPAIECAQPFLRRFTGQGGFLRRADHDKTAKRFMHTVGDRFRKEWLEDQKIGDRIASNATAIAFGEWFEGGARAEQRQPQCRFDHLILPFVRHQRVMLDIDHARRLPCSLHEHPEPHEIEWQLVQHGGAQQAGHELAPLQHIAVECVTFVRVFGTRVRASHP